MPQLKTEIFKKAFYYYQSGLVELKYNDGKKAWFEIDKEEVRLDIDKVVKLSCTCRFHGIKGIKYKGLCAREIAALIYIYFKKGKLPKAGVIR